ncbi:DUF4149 domain-containing protein [Azohydromonas sediminis]|uniref:DUF4149 domain-containing protein n=1 Tax=Azohydromonas sediminis TaxID=2259674 RepID=UPI000E65E848|nr:DUF4149 domain-containing protein [Azohydromonas sediminis]
MNRVERARALLAGLWAGVLLAVAGIATPAPFATLATADAGRVVARVLASEAYLSLAAAVVLFLLERRRARDGAPAMTVEVMLVLGALLCTVAGYFALQPMMAAARAGQGPWSFGTLHAVSTVFFGVKALLVLVLAWRCTAAGIAPR